MFLMGLIVAGSATLAFAIGIPSGPVGVARAYAIANTIIAYPVLLMGHRACGLSIARTVAESAPLLLCALIMGGIVWLIGVGSNAVGMGLHGRLATKIVIGVFTYTICLRQLARPTYFEILGQLAT
jgi:hypothetical protein